MTFRGLLYTDCRANESLRGGTGYQFQAASADARLPDEVVMLQHLMYRPSADLMAREAPLADYPTSFGYTKTADGYAIGAGTYLGRVSGDGRQGNQITHGLFTDDMADFAATRPAQLFGADFWIYEKQASKQLDTLEPPLVYREEFDLEALHEVAIHAPDPESFLAKVISAFEGASGDTWVKATVSCSNPLTAMQWISLGTILMPTDEALNLSIRAFVNEPVSATQRIVAVHPPSMNRQIPVTTLQAIKGIDLDTYVTSPIAITERAAYWAAKFVTGDPYEVIDAIELAGRLKASESTNRIVSGVVMLSESLTSAEAVNAVADSFESFDDDEFDELADLLVHALEHAEQSAGLTPDPFMRILSVVRRLGIAHAELADRLQENLLVRASATKEFATQLVADSTLAWSWRQPPAIDSPASRSLLATFGQLDDASLPNAFEFAGRSGIAIDATKLAAPIHRLAKHWAQHAELADRHRSWVYGDRVLDLTVEALQQEVECGPSAAVGAALADGRWDWLLELEWVLRGGGPLAAEIASRSIPNADVRRKQYLIEKIATSTGPDGWIPLWRNRMPELAEVLHWLDVRPMDVTDTRFAAVIGPAVGKAVDSGHVHGRTLKLIDDIYATVADKLPPSVARIGRENVEIGRELRALRERRERPGAGRRMAAVDPIILNIRSRQIVAALLNDAAEVDRIDFLARCPIDPSEELVAALDELAHRFPVETLKIVFGLSRAKLPKSILRRLNLFPLHWYETASGQDRERVAEKLHRDWPEWEETELQFERKHESSAKKVRRLFGHSEKER